MPAVKDTLPRLFPPAPISYPFEQHRPRLFYVRLPEEQIYIQRDSMGTYRSQRLLFQMPLASPLVMDFRDYAERYKQYSIQQNWDMLIREREAEASEAGLLDFRVDVPGGEESTFTTIFGKPEVNLRINGTANLNVGASIQKTENPSIPPDRQRQIDPTFEQSLQLNIQGTIGDKLSIQTDWDTERAFDFMNRVNIRYEGYEDEILQHLEMGNVSMQTGNSLIRGGSALFGVKSIVQLGSLKLTSVLSQQEGEERTETITGGAQEKELAIRPVDYEDDRHFFMDFYTRQQFEENVSNPQQLGQALQLTEVNVWALRETSQSVEGERQAIALSDLGVVQNADSSFSAPSEQEDIFSQGLLDQYRDPSLGVSAGDFGVDPASFVEGYFIPLQEGVDYELNRYLGYISLKRNLGSRQALAISFKYVNPQTGQTVSIGDVSPGGGNRIYLKLIRPQTVTTTNPLWDLMMKNIYAIGASNLTPDGLELDVKYTEQNIPSSSLPSRSSILLQDLGLDRVDQQGALNPDNRIDFSTSVLDPGTGRILFPYLQPFGNRIEELLSESGLSPPEIGSIAFEELYAERKENASQNSKNNFYLIEGQAKGALSASYSLGYSLVEGSVRVFANGQELQEGTDYAVDYSIGSITILNERYLQRGQQIKIEYENNQLAQIGQKNFTGLRAEYNILDNFNIGTTYFKLKEKPLQDKIRIGNEPVSNAVLGLDANAYFDLPWLTRLVDRVPLLQTKEPSAIRLNGEFAQLRPGVSRTAAVNDAISDNRLFRDEERGLSFIDDFEGSEIGLSFMNPSQWNLASAPAAVPGYEADEVYFTENAPASPSNTITDKIARSDLRSTFAWYTIPQNIEDILEGVERTPESQRVKVTDVFPNRDVLTEENFIRTLDLYYDPTERGPYNYNRDLRNILQDEPERTWGGMTTTLPAGQEDLTQNNIEFLEFWVQSVLPGGRAPTVQDLEDYEGTIYVDVGVVSEDVIPNFKTNTEDGLVRRPNDLQQDNISNDPRSYIPVPPPPPEGQFSNERRALEDVGLDGAPNTEGIDNKNEQTLFANFLDAMSGTYGEGSSAFDAIEADPSNDDYVFYGERELDGRPLNERFHRMYGYHDGNTPPNTGDKQAVTNRPDTEGLITPSIVEQNNAYFQYEVDWNPATVDEAEVGAAGGYIVDKIDGPNQHERWYQVRIPLEDWIRKVGNIENFQNVSYIRLWLSGYEKPFTLRFATFELVGSQWRNADNVDQEQGPVQGELDISSVNIEENSQRRPIPYRQPEGAIRATNRGRQRQTIANEQSIAMGIQNLGPGELKMMKRVYPGGLNMIHYSNVRMYVHGEGYDHRGDAELVVRYGTDLTNNYYEYRQPISPSDPDYPYSQKPSSELSSGVLYREAEEVWLYEENSMNILLRAFNELKQLRNQQEGNPSDRYERADILTEAPPGAVIAIKGNPSLDRVGEIGIGIQNPFNPQNPSGGGVPLLNGQFWVNELRVSGFDNQSGWAANAKAEIQVADFASVNANLNRETDGFGALNSRLGQRRLSDVLAYDVNSTVNMHKFLPARYGWNIPVTFSTRQSNSTPRYLPNQGDIRLTDFKNAVQSRSELTDMQKERLISQQIFESQTAVESYSVNMSNVTKTRSQSNLAKYTLDNTTFNYVYNTTDRRNPQYSRQDNWNYSGSLRYNMNFRSTRLFRPFDFLGEVPLLHPLAGIKFGYTPASVNASFGIDREYTEQLRRSLTGRLENTLQQSHSFTYDTEFGLGYNLTPSIKTTFQTRTVFDLSRAGVDHMPSVTDSARYVLRPSFDVLQDLVFDSLSSRRSNYQEAYTAGWQPNFNRISAIDWASYSANYGGGYQWRNSPAGSELGANLSNNLSLNQSVDFDLQNLLERMPWYRNLTGDDPGYPARDTGKADTSTADRNSELRSVAEKGLQALLSIQSIDVTFSISKSSMQSGYAGNSQLFHMVSPSDRGFSPPFSYRTGFSDRIGFSRLIDNPGNSSIQLPSNRNLSDDLTIGAQFRPFENLSIDFTWNTQWNKTNTQSITLNPDESFNTVRTESGRISSSIWAFGAGYGTFFREQLQTAFEDINAQSRVISDETGNRDGQSVLGKRSLQADFRKAYLGIGSKAVGDRNFTPFPLPGWRLTWSGLESFFPLIGNSMTRASVTHTYTGLYRLGWVYNANRDLLPDISLGNYTIQNRRPEYEANTVNIEQRFSPLLGLNITWESNLRSSLQYEYSKLASLALSNSTVIERLSRGLRFTFAYTLRDFKIPLFSRIENAVDFTINGSYIEDEEKKYVLDSDLGNALEGGTGDFGQDLDQYDFSRSFTGGQSRINGSAVIGYQFSQTIQANFEYAFSRLIPKSSNIYARTDHDLRFNVVVSIRSD
ncbi:cell surface protein SprA [Fodinibius sediminis]|nr:cell surface protein SprA [Fodinibius sediminis]